jgi:hypothetical protein
MNYRTLLLASVLSAGCSVAPGGETVVASLKDMSNVELKYAGFELGEPTTVHIKATGGGGSQGWTYKSDKMFAYGWILNADTREPVWEMTTSNTQRHGADRVFDGSIKLPRGSYEVYFAACTFVHHTTFTHFDVNVDHRKPELFGSGSKTGNHFFSWLTEWWSDDAGAEWNKRSPTWGIELLADGSMGGSISHFTPPKQSPAAVLRATGLGDNVVVRRAFTLSAPADIDIRALGENAGGEECSDFSWIVNAHSRERVWEMQCHDTQRAGGAEKNTLTLSHVRFDKGTYVLYCITDDSHSAADWNAPPPYDPLNYGVTLTVKDARERTGFTAVPYNEDRNIIVSIVKVGNDESRSEGFVLKQKTLVRVLAFGERSSNRRTMADFGVILDAKTRARVWTMDPDRTSYGGGASKNRYIDELVLLPAGNYLVTYQTDDSHAYGDWNSDPPFDPDHYGIIVEGADPDFSPSRVERYSEEHDKSIIAQIVRVEDNANRSVQFSCDRTTRVRVYAIGEAQDKTMYDYGWIEDARTGTVIWEMTYGMTFHAGGARKNRMLNSTIVLDKGNYVLRYKTDDSHAWNDWNAEAPDDRDYYGITLYRETDTTPPPPAAPSPPRP